MPSAPLLLSPAQNEALGWLVDEGGEEKDMPVVADGVADGPSPHRPWFAEEAAARLVACMFCNTVVYAPCKSV